MANDGSDTAMDRLKKPWIVALLVAAVVMFVVDLAVGINSLDDEGEEMPDESLDRTTDPHLKEEIENNVGSE